MEYFFLRKLGQLLSLNSLGKKAQEFPYFVLAEYIIYIYMSYEANFRACKDHAKQANNVTVDSMETGILNATH